MKVKIDTHNYEIKLTNSLIGSIALEGMAKALSQIIPTEKDSFSIQVELQDWRVVVIIGDEVHSLALDHKIGKIEDHKADEYSGVK